MSNDMYNKMFNLLNKEIEEGLHLGDDIRMASISPYGIPSGIPQLDLYLGAKGGLPAAKIIEFYGKPMVGKAENVMNKIRTSKGWVKMKDLEVGDEVCTPDGSTAKIKGVYPQGRRQLFKVILRDGRSVEVDGDHLWKVYCSTWRQKSNSGRRGDWRVLTTKEILRQKTHTKNRIHLPLPKAVFGFDQELLINPYVLGALLGDGSFRSESKIQFTCANPTLIKALNQKTVKGYRFTHRYGLQYHLVGAHNNRSNIYIKALRDLNLWGCYSYEKFIPDSYFNASASQRLALLQGLMDTDGSCSKTGHIRFTSASKLLAKQVQMLIWSLGGSAKIQAYTRHNRRTEYVVSILHPERANLFGVKTVVLPKRNQFTSNEIVKIEKVKASEAKCIAIDHPEQLYITENYVVTHNTTAALQAMSEWQKRGGMVFFLDTENSFTPLRAREVGLDPSRVIKSEPETIEQVFDHLLKMLSTLKDNDFDKPVLFVVDSTTAVPTQADIEGNLDKSDRPGYEAKQIKRGLKKINHLLGDLKCKPSIIFINHAVTKVGVSYGKQTDSGGGLAIKFYSAVRCEFAHKGNLTEKSSGRRLGQKIEISIEKLKGGSLEYPKFQVALHNGVGFNRYESLHDAMVATGYAHKPKGSKVTTVLPGTDDEEQFSNTDLLEWLEKKGGYEKVYASWRKHAIDAGIITPWGAGEGSN